MRVEVKGKLFATHVSAFLLHISLSRIITYSLVNFWVTLDRHRL